MSTTLLGTIEEAISGHRCVTAWLGYGNALFLGFGPDVLPFRAPDGRRSKPPFELQTSLAGWRIDGEICASADDEPAVAELAVGELIGKPVVRWELQDERYLKIEFESDSQLQLLPPKEVDLDLEEWWFCLPGSRYVGVGSDGRIVEGSTDSN